MLLPELAQREMAWAKHSKALLGGKTTLQLSGGAEVTLTHRPLAIEARVGGKPALRFNSEGLLNYEHRREKQARVTTSLDCSGFWGCSTPTSALARLCNRLAL